MTLPSGGYHRYQYDRVAPLSQSLNYGGYAQGNRGVVKRWISAKGDGSDEIEWNYSAQHIGTLTTTFLTTVTSPNGSRAERVIHEGFMPGSAGNLFGYENSRAGQAYEERTYNSSNALIRRTLTEWVENSTTYPYDQSANRAAFIATRDPRPIKRVEILLDTGGDALASTTTTSYDQDLNQTENNRYDHASVNQTTAQTGDINSMPLGAPLRTDSATFLVNDPNISQATRDAYRARNLLALPTEQLVKNAAGTVVAATKLSYDEADYAPLTYPTVTGYTDPGTPYRGNVTTTEQWLNFDGSNFQTYPNGSFIVTHAQPDQCGNERKVWDANGNLTQTFYTDSFSDSINRNTYAFPTGTSSPVPDPSGYYAASVSFTTSNIYDFQTGKVISTTDVNGQSTTYSYANDQGQLDPLNRLKKVTLPRSLGETKYEYGDTPGSVYVRTLTKQNASAWLDDYTYLDGVGRVKRASHYEGPSSWSVKETEYDSLGRVWKVSNPYFATSSNPSTTPGEWTTTTYDALGRVLTVTTPDGSVITTSYSGNQITVADAMNRQRRSVADGLGRLSQVVEDPSGANYLTTYEYDALGNLLKVNQGAQQRFFLYDSLSRLIRAKNPEHDAAGAIALSNPWMTNNQWSMKYVYDANGNLTSRTASSGPSGSPSTTATTYAYDALNRNIYVGYSDGTPTVERHYDGMSGTTQLVSYGKGRLYYNLSQITHPTSGQLAWSRTVINSYDAVGRVLNQSQGFLINNGTTWMDYTVGQSYDLAGHVTSNTYPSGRTVNYSYDAGGRTSNFSGSLGDGVPLDK